MRRNPQPSTLPVNLDTPTLSSSSVAIYPVYDADNPPAHPGPSWTRFVCISDTHSRIYPVPPGDVLLHAGDLSNGGKLKALKVTLDWLKMLPHPIKIIIAGNHDLCLDNDWQEGGEWASYSGHKMRSRDIDTAQKLIRSDELVDAGVHYLEYESMHFTTTAGRTWNVYGSPAAPRYSLGAFQYEYEEGAEIHARIPSSTEILLTHTPPYGTLNQTRKGTAAGCKDLASRLESEDLSRCKLHVFGHIHESHGAVISGGTGDGSEDAFRVSVNAAMANGGQAVIVDLKN